jgi:hypothetical protein
MRAGVAARHGSRPKELSPVKCVKGWFIPSSSWLWWGHVGNPQGEQSGMSPPPQCAAISGNGATSSPVVNLAIEPAEK